jgi:hypothetical protein
MRPLRSKESVGTSAIAVAWTNSVPGAKNLSRFEPTHLRQNSSYLGHATEGTCRTFPARVVCEWMGNSEAVARKHYLQVTDDNGEYH